MRICHLTSVHKPTDVRIFYKECISLKKIADEVHLIAPYVTDSEVQGVFIHGVLMKKSRIKRMTETVKEVYEKAIEIDADVYHFHDPELLPIGKKLKRKGKVVVYDVHEDLPRQLYNKYWIPKFFRKVASRVIENYENSSAKKFDLIVAATPFIRDRFLKNGCNAIDVNNFPVIEELSTNQTLWENKKDNICYVGGISFIRGIKELVLAIGNTKHVSLLLAGTFTSESQKEVVKELPGWNQVTELGFLDREGVKDVYENSKIGMVTLHPTINYIDALPVKMFEYMAAGIPIISSNFPLWNKIVRENECGITVDPLNVDEITEAIEKLINNPKLAKKLGHNGRIAVEQKFNWGLESKKLIRAYENILKKDEMGR